MEDLRGEAVNQKVESKRFLDKVLHFMGIQEDEEPLDDEIAVTGEPKSAPREPAAQRSGRLVSLPGAARTSGLRVVVAEPKSFDDVQPVADHLKERRPVIVSLEAVDRELSKRIIDFMSGTCYALDGNIQRIGDDIFIITPSNVSIDGDLAERWREPGIFS